MIPQLVVLSSRDKQDTYLGDLVASLSLSPFDVVKIIPDNTKAGLGIDHIRMLSQAITTQTPRKRIVAIYSFETATPEAQNALLKILEEKTHNNVFILFANTIGQVIPTIRSRVQALLLEKGNILPDAELTARMQELFKALHNPDSNSYLRLGAFPIKTREDTLLFLYSLMIFLKSHLKGKNATSAIKIIKKTLQTKMNIFYFNANHQL